MKKTPEISVVMACHNAAPYLKFAVDSVLNQSFKNWELIIVDDASTDDSLSIIKYAADTDPRIQYISLPCNIGAGAARNAGADIAKGKWLAILDADDIFFPEKLEKQLSAIRNCNNKNLILVGSGCYHIDRNGQRLKKYSYPSASESLINNLLKRKKFPPHSSILYRADTFRRLGGFNMRFLRAQDYDLWLRLSDIGDFACLTEPLIEYRHHSTNISNNAAINGYSQLEYGIAARVCYMLRKAGNKDPAMESDVQCWDSFMELISSVLKKSLISEYHQWKINIKNELTDFGSNFKKFFSVCGLLVYKPFFLLWFLKEHTTSIDFESICYREWIKQ